MNLPDAQQAACLHHPDPPATIRDALMRLATSAASSQAAFDRDHLVQSQTDLEDTLLNVLVALQKLDIHPEHALMRSLNRLTRQTRQTKTFRIYDDRVEIWANGVCRGEWALYTQEDFDMAMRVAQDLGCTVDIREAQQLDLFQQALMPS